MSDAVSSFSLITESFQKGAKKKIEAWLTGMGAIASNKAMVKYSELPFMATQDAHGFAWSRKHDGWVDILQSDDQLKQVVCNIRYPKQRWFSKQKKDWQALNNSAGKLFGSAKTFDFGEKQGRLYKTKDIDVLLTAYQKSRSSHIEIKIARGGFCS
ncbi:hypothetical protein [Halioxenophilus sp. WMMB6]|uniref:hypothetical protein n=1 Tax=Halioxenophilus sp. WMMB6 TaxID=3073815 RepID=UPI00295E541F|nr:hypothetical protein [Halioxenophilus sp. WMMB6]